MQLPTVPDLAPLGVDAILSLPAAKNRIEGREIDIEVTRRIFGRDAHDDIRFTGLNRRGGWGRGWIVRGDYGTFNNLYDYSDDVGCAFLIVEKLSNKASFKLKKGGYGWRAIFEGQGLRSVATATHPALAICRAALLWAAKQREATTAPP